MILNFYCFRTHRFNSQIVAWIRLSTQTILTMNSNMITKNHRFSVHSVSSDAGEEWVLTVRDVRATDRGWYMCQVNTGNSDSVQGFLEVNGGW